VLDVGGGPGAYAVWLARRGYAVRLIDPVELHVTQAREASAAQPDAPLAGAEVSDARELPAADRSVDAVLLLGPLYHLPEAADRDRALREARRVLRPRGRVLAAAISYFAPTIDGIRNAKLDEPGFEALIEHDLRAGIHRNPDGHPGWFTTASSTAPSSSPPRSRRPGSRSRRSSRSRAWGTTRSARTTGSTARRAGTRSCAQSAASRPSPRCSARAPPARRRPRAGRLSPDGAGGTQPPPIEAVRASWRTSDVSPPIQHVQWRFAGVFAAERPDKPARGCRATSVVRIRA
jgi:hypothetical protein